MGSNRIVPKTPEMRLTAQGTATKGASLVRPAEAGVKDKAKVNYFLESVYVA